MIEPCRRGAESDPCRLGPVQSFQTPSPARERVKEPLRSTLVRSPYSKDLTIQALSRIPWFLNPARQTAD